MKKLCIKCLSQKSYSAFYKKYGGNICKECHNRRSRDYYLKNREKLLRKSREKYFKNRPEGSRRNDYSTTEWFKEIMASSDLRTVKDAFKKVYMKWIVTRRL